MPVDMSRYPANNPRTNAEIGTINGTAQVLPTPTPPLTTRHLLGGVRAMPQSTRSSWPTLHCQQCNTAFQVHPRRIGTAKYCSRACQAAGYRQAADERGRRWYKHAALSDGRKYEHQSVAEATIGRPLQPDEIVHHIDGDKFNNDPSNLQVMSRTDHVRLHAGVLGRWSAKWDACVECGTDERKHHSNGLCQRCRSRMNQRKRAERRRANGQV